MYTSKIPFQFPSAKSDEALKEPLEHYASGQG